MFQTAKAQFKRFWRQQKLLCSKTNSACPFCTQGRGGRSTAELEWLTAQNARLWEIQAVNEPLLRQGKAIIWEVDWIFFKNRNNFSCLVSCFEICVSSNLYECINNCQMFWTSQGFWKCCVCANEREAEPLIALKWLCRGF